MSPFRGGRWAWAITLHLCLLLVAVQFCTAEQRNVTIFDADTRITFNPKCPDMRNCAGAWFTYPFQIVDGIDTTEGPATVLTIAYGPAVAFRNITPSATFTFQGTAIYYYTVVSAWTATMAITIDDGTPTMVNLTRSLRLNKDTLYNLEVLAWQATGLDPNAEHKFYLEWAEGSGHELDAFVGFNKLVVTQNVTDGTVTNDDTRDNRTTLNLPAGMSKTLLNLNPNNNTIGGAETPSGVNKTAVIASVAGSIGAIVIILILIGFFTKRGARNNAARNAKPGDWNPIFDSERPGGTYINLDAGSGKSRYSRWDDEHRPMNPYSPAYTLPGSESPHSGKLDTKFEQHQSTVHVPLLAEDDSRHSMERRHPSG